METNSGFTIFDFELRDGVLNARIKYEWQQQGRVPERDCFQQGTAPNSSHVLWKRNFLAILHPPIVVNNKVIGGANLNGRVEMPLGFLYALDQNTGDVIWTTNMTDALTSGRSYGSKLMKIDEQHFMYVQEGNFTIYEIETGRLALTFRAGEYLGSPGVYVPELKTWFGVGSFTEFVAHTIEAWDFSNIIQPTMLWKSDPLEQIDLRFHYENGRIHVGSYDFTEYCLDAKTGDILWQKDMKGFTSYYGTAAYSKIFVGSINNFIWALDPTTGKVLWEFKPDGYGSFSGGIAAAYNKVFMLNADGYLYAVDAETGKEVWKYRAFEPNATHPQIIHNANIYGAVADGKVYWLVADRETKPPNAGLAVFVCLNAETGKEIWHSYEAEMRCPTIAYGKLFGQDWINDGSIFTADWKIANRTGAYLWCFGKGPINLKIGTDTRDLYGLPYIALGGKTSIIGNATDLSSANLGEPAKNVPVNLSWKLPDGTTGEIGTTYTDEYGKLFLKWKPPKSGNYTIIANSNGNDDYEVAPKATAAITVNPTSDFQIFLPISIAVIFIAIVLPIIYIRRRRKK